MSVNLQDALATGTNDSKTNDGKAFYRNYCFAWTQRLGHDHGMG